MMENKNIKKKLEYDINQDKKEIDIIDSEVKFEQKEEDNAITYEIKIGGGD